LAEAGLQAPERGLLLASAARLPWSPWATVGPWLCVPAFRAVCLCLRLLAVSCIESAWLDNPEGQWHRESRRKRHLRLETRPGRSNALADGVAVQLAHSARARGMRRRNEGGSHTLWGANTLCMSVGLTLRIAFVRGEQCRTAIPREVTLNPLLASQTLCSVDTRRAAPAECWGRPILHEHVVPSTPRFVQPYLHAPLGEACILRYRPLVVRVRFSVGWCPLSLSVRW